MKFQHTKQKKHTILASENQWEHQTHIDRKGFFMIRKIIHIDEEKCNGCGACAAACHEGAIAIVDGKARLKIPAGTQPGKVLRLRGKGLPQYGTSNRGDELVNVMVYVPENLTDDERKAIESLQGKPNVTPDQGTAHRIFSRLRHIFHRESQGDTQGN